MLKDVMAKNKSLTAEKDGLQGQIKILMKRMKDLEGEAEDALASAEAANMSKSSVEKDWTERLVKVSYPCYSFTGSACCFNGLPDIAACQHGMCSGYLRVETLLTHCQELINAYSCYCMQE